jgi:sugar/nucleoside kinase (ribokinase family)
LNVADTVGAGDSHIGSFIALRHLGTDLIEAVRKANRVSAAVVGCPGALLDHEAFLKLGL